MSSGRVSSIRISDRSPVTSRVLQKSRKVWAKTCSPSRKTMSKRSRQPAKKASEGCWWKATPGPAAACQSKRNSGSTAVFPAISTARKVSPLLTPTSR